MLQSTADRAAAALTTRTDAQLVGEAVHGNQRAFDELYRRHSQAAWRVAQSVTRNAHDAADAVSESFVKVLTAVGAGQLREGAMFRSYLLTTTRRCAIDVMRRHGRTRPTDDEQALDGAAPNATPAEKLEGGEDAALVAAAFRDLPERWRSVLWLTEVEGMPAREAAAVLGLTANGTAQLAVRARAGLRERYLQAHLRTATAKECQFTVERLGAYVAGALSPRDLAKVDQHLAGCEGCRQRREELEDLRKPLRLALIPFPLALGGLAAARWKAATIASGTPLTGGSWWARPPEWAQRALAGAAAAVFVVGAISTTWISPGGRSDPPPRELAAPASAEAPDAVFTDVETHGAFEVGAQSLDEGVARSASAPEARGSAMPTAPSDPGSSPAEPPASATDDDPLDGILGLLPGSDGGGDGGGDGGEGGATTSTAEVTVGGRSGDDAFAVQVEVGGDECTGATVGTEAIGCTPDAPEDDGLTFQTGGEILPEQDLSLP